MKARCWPIGAILSRLEWVIPGGVEAKEIAREGANLVCFGLSDGAQI